MSLKINETSGTKMLGYKCLEGEAETARHGISGKGRVW